MARTYCLGKIFSLTYRMNTFPAIYLVNKINIQLPLKIHLTDHSMRQQRRGDSMTNKSTANKSTTNNSMTNKSMANKSTTNNSMTNKSMTSKSMGQRVGNGRTNSVRVGGSSLVGHLGNVTSQIIGIVVDMLDPSIRKIDRVLARNSSSSIIRLSLGKVSTRVVIRHSILVGVGRGLSQVIHITTNSMSYGMGANQRGMGNNSMANKSTTNKSMGNKSTTNKSMTSKSTGEELRGSRGDSQESRIDKGLHCEL